MHVAKINKNMFTRIWYLTRYFSATHGCMGKEPMWMLR